MKNKRKLYKYMLKNNKIKLLIKQKKLSENQNRFFYVYTTIFKVVLFLHF